MWSARHSAVAGPLAGAGQKPRFAVVVPAMRRRLETSAFLLVLLALVLSSSTLVLSPRLLAAPATGTRSTAVDPRAGTASSSTASQTLKAATSPVPTPAPLASRAPGIRMPTPAPVSAATPGRVPACTTAFGMYQSNAPWSFTAISTLESELNRHSAIVHWYAQWGNQSGVYSPTVQNLLAGVRAHGSTPLITWEPWNQPPATDNPFPLASIASGAFDTYIDSWATGIAAYGHPVLLSFAHEMNGNWYPWGANINGNTPAQYVAAYRHVHDRFALKGAGNVQWVFTMSGDPYGSWPNVQGFYPGSAYVDWLASDVYNFGTTQPWSSWQPLGFLLQLDYTRLTALSATKPLMLAEMASVEQGGSKAAWIQNAAATLGSQFPRVQAAVWFSRSGTGLALDSSATALAAARAAFGAPPYCRTFPY